MKKENGITLIALVVTIIILIILAGITINLLLSENGILDRARRVKIEQTIAEEKESISLAAGSAKIDSFGVQGENYGVITKDLLQTSLNNDLNNRRIGNAAVSDKRKDGSFIITYEDSGRQYILHSDLSVTAINSEEDLEEILEPTPEEIFITQPTADGNLKIVAIKDEYLQENANNSSIYDIVIDGEITKKIVVPKQIDGKDVVELVNGLGRYNIEEFVIQEGVKTVAAIFQGSKTIKKVVLPKGLETLYNAFYQSSIEEVNIPGSVKILEYNFSECTSLTSVKIENGVEEIGGNAFYGCTSLPQINMPESVKIIGKLAFYECSGLEQITMNNGLEKIDYQAFQYCSSLQQINVPDTVTSIGFSAFDGCSSASVINLGSGLQTIGSTAFQNCTSVIKVEIPETVTTLDYNIFQGCTSLQEVGLYANAYKESLFMDCTSLKKVIVGNNNSVGTLRIASGLLYGAKAVEEVEVRDSIGEIAISTFANLPNLKKVTIGKGVKLIGANAFGDCPKLEEVIINDAPVVLSNGGTGIFNNSNNITNLQLGNRVVSIGNQAFSTFKFNTQKFIIPSSVTSIGEYAFVATTGIQEIVIPNSVTSIGNIAFADSTIEKVVIPSSLKIIPPSIFAGCANLSSVEIQSGVESLSGNAFGRCTSLTTIRIPSTVTSIEPRTFIGCPNLATIVLETSAQEANYAEDWNLIAQDETGENKTYAQVVYE